MNRAFIGVGSNEGERVEHISKALRALSAMNGTRLIQMAAMIETEPIGPPQGPYLNTVIEIETTLEPVALLRTLRAIEQAAGRLPSAQRWGPRVIDLDILLYDDRILSEPALIIPHPRMHERRFVLEPLAQLAPHVAHPVLKQTIAELLAALPVSPPHSSPITHH